MALLKLTPMNEPVVRSKTKHVPLEMIKTPEFQQLIDDMIQTMYETNGIGLAATQIGKDLNLATLVPDPEKFEYYEKGSREAIVIINPEMKGQSLRSNVSEEGCLSVPGFMGLVRRNNAVTVSYTDRDGKHREEKARGLLARVYQHEIDHLAGTLFIDRAEKIFKIHHL